MIKPRLAKISRNLWSLLIVFTLFSFCFANYVYTEKQIGRENEIRYNSYLLANELRHSSDDLTRMVRSYAATGNPIFKQHYLEILGIRDGKNLRPVCYSQLYWDLVKDDNQRPCDFGQAIALLELMQQAGFTVEEFADLAQAKVNSDTLTHIEFEAIKLIETNNPPTMADRMSALLMLNDSAYHLAKAEIMHPIGEFLQKMDLRTLNAVHKAELRALQMRLVFVLFGVILAFKLFRNYQLLHATLGASVKSVYAHIAKIGGGDFYSPVPVKQGMENSIMGWLSETQINLAKLDNERKQAVANIVSASDYARSLLEASLDPLVTISTDGKITDVNQATELVTGYSRFKLIGNDFSDYFTEPDKAREWYQRVFKEERLTDYPLAIRHRTGKIADVLYNASVYRDSQRKVIGVFAAARDITKRKQAEEQLVGSNDFESFQ